MTVARGDRPSQPARSRARRGRPAFRTRRSSRRSCAAPRALSAATTTTRRGSSWGTRRARARLPASGERGEGRVEDRRDHRPSPDQSSSGRGDPRNVGRSAQAAPSTSQREWGRTQKNHVPPLMRIGFSQAEHCGVLQPVGDDARRQRDKAALVPPRPVGRLAVGKAFRTLHRGGGGAGQCSRLDVAGLHVEILKARQYARSAGGAFVRETDGRGAHPDPADREVGRRGASAGEALSQFKSCEFSR